MKKFDETIIKTAAATLGDDFGLGGGGTIAPAPGPGPRANRTSKPVQELQEKYPEAVRIIKQMQQVMQAASLWLTQKYAGEENPKDSEYKNKKTLVARFHLTQEKMNMAAENDGVWGPNTRKSLESVQDYINKYHSTAGIKPLIIASPSYTNTNLVQQAVDNNRNSIAELAFAEGINLPGANVAGRLAKGKPLDRIPVEYATASTALGTEDPTGVTILAADLGSLVALKTKLDTGGFKTDEISKTSKAIDDISFQIFLNQDTGERTASISSAKTEDIAGYYDSKQDTVAYADTYWARTAAFFFNTLIPAMRDRSKESVAFFNAFPLIKGNGANLMKMLAETANRYKDSFSHDIIIDNNFKTILTINDNINSLLFNELESFAKMIGQRSRARDFRNKQNAGSIDKALAMFGDVDVDDFLKEILPKLRDEFSTLKKYSDNELRKYFLTSAMTTGRLDEKLKEFRKNPASVPSDMNAFLGRRQQLQEVITQRSSMWTYGMLLAVAEMVKNRANTQLNIAGGGKTAANKYDLEKEADAISWVQDKARGVGQAINEFTGNKPSAGSEAIKQDPITVRIKTEYVRLANALIGQIHSLEKNIMLNLKGKRVNRETLNGIVVPDDYLDKFTGSQGKKGGPNGPGGEGSYGNGSNGNGSNGNNFGSGGSGGFGSERSGKKFPSRLPFDPTETTLNLSLLTQWMTAPDIGRFSQGWNSVLAREMPRIPIADIGSRGTLFADLPERLGGLREANTYLNMIKKAIYTILQILEENVDYITRNGFTDSQISSQYQYGNNLVNWLNITQQRVGTTG